MNLVSDNWTDYEIIDSGNGMKLERWGNIVLSRPDPQVIWKPIYKQEWNKADAVYNRSSKGGGAWIYNKEIPEKWTVSYNELRFYVEPTGFKHTGLFPEQAVNWDFCRSIIEQAIKDGKKSVKVLNLFGYSGAATVACAKAGATVCHVDASKGMVTRAKENIMLSGLSNAEVRYIVDDAFKFVTREVKRGSKYDGIIMDPPSYGRGPNGEVWKLEDSLFSFVEECASLLSDDALFFILNSYTTGLSSFVTKNILTMNIQDKKKGNILAGDLCLPITSHKNMHLPCGTYARWSREDFCEECNG